MDMTNSGRAGVIYASGSTLTPKSRTRHYSSNVSNAPNPQGETPPLTDHDLNPVGLMKGAEIMYSQPQQKLGLLVAPVHQNPRT